MKVGIFDSGAGGLTVLRECARLCRGVRFLYYGDNANAPYGNRSEGEIGRLVFDGVRTLGDAGAEAVVLACNTATAVCADALRRQFPFPVVGMEPAVKVAARQCRRALLLSTVRTAQSGRLSALVARFPACSFTVYGSAGLAGAIEEWLGGGEEVELSAHLPRGAFDGVVLGCTHYVFLKDEIAAYYGLPVFDGNAGTARRLNALLDGSRVDGNRGNHTNTNKSLPCAWMDEGGCSVEFIGESGQKNQKIYERMFNKS